MKQRINSISPIDGRYFDKVQVLSNFFSEKALIKYRLKIEIEYFPDSSSFISSSIIHSASQEAKNADLSDPFLSCLACDITIFTRIFRKIRAKNVISQTRQDKKGAMNWGQSVRK